MISSANNTTIAKNTIFLSIRMVFVLIVSLYTSRVTLQILGIEDFGIYNVVGGLVSMFTFMNGSLINGIQRFYNFELGKNGPEGAQRVFNAAVRIQLVLSFILLFLCETIGLWYLYEKLVVPPERFIAAFVVFQVSILSMILGVTSVPYSSAIIAHEKLGYYSVVSIVDTFLKLGIILVLPKIPGDKLIVYGILLIIISLANWLMYYIYSRKMFSETRLSGSIEKSMFAPMLSFSGWNLMGTFTVMAKNQGLNMILNLFFGPVVNAARGVAYQVNSAIVGFVANINMAARPQIVQSYANGDALRVVRLMNTMSKLCFLILFIIGLPICLEVDYILYLWLGTNIPEMTNIFLILVIVTSVFNNMNAPVAIVVHAVGRLKRYQIVTTIIGVMVLPVSYFCLKAGAEPVSVFVVALLFEIFNSIATIILLRALFYFSIGGFLKSVYLKSLIVAILSFLISFVPRYCLDESLMRLMIVTSISVITVLLFGFLILLDKQEKTNVKQFVYNKFKLKHNEQ